MKKLALLLLPLVFLFSSCEEFKEVTVSGIDSFYLKKVSQEGLEAELNVKIKNPNNRNFTIYPSEFDVSFSGMRLGKARLDKKVKIDRNAERVYTFKLKSNLGDINLMDLPKLLSLNNLGNIEVKGDLKAGKLFIKKRFPVSYSEKIKIFK